MSSVFWRRIADYSQRSVSITLAGLTVLGLVILGQEGQGVVHRYKQGKALKKSMANTASQDNQVSCKINPLYHSLLYYTVTTVASFSS
jgi:DNA-binding transcriptional ArsR family regulator